MANPRTFYAVTTGHDYQSMLSRWLEPVRVDQRYREFKWIPPVNYHMTLAFLGNVTESQLIELELITRQCAKAIDNFSLLFNKLNYFPNPARAKVLALIPGAGQEGGEPLSSLHHCLHKALLPLGLALRQGPLRPHLSVARVKSSAQAVSPLEQSQHPHTFCTPLLADNLTLLCSEQTPDGSRYSPIFSQPLGAMPRERGGD